MVFIEEKLSDAMIKLLLGFIQTCCTQFKKEMKNDFVSYSNIMWSSAGKKRLWSRSSLNSK